MRYGCVVFALAGWMSACGGDATSEPKQPPAQSPPITPPPSAPVTGTYVFWTRATAQLPITIGDTVNDLGQLLEATTEPTTCNAAKTVAVPAPTTGSTQFLAFGPKFGNVGYTVSAKSGCFTIEVAYDPVKLEAMLGGDGAGTVESQSGAIDCTLPLGARQTGTCSTTRTRFTTWTLTATPAPGSYLHSWDGPCAGIAKENRCTLSTKEDYAAVLVNFRKNPADTLLLTLRTTNGAPYGATGTFGASPGNGSITPYGTCTLASTQTSTTCKILVPRGLTAQIVGSNLGNTFAGWDRENGQSEQCTLKYPVCNTIMRGQASATERVAALLYPPGANPNNYSVSVSVDGIGGGTVRDAAGKITCTKTPGVAAPVAHCAFNSSAGATITLTATPTSPYVFSGWEGTCTGINPTCTFTVASVAGAGVVATFWNAAPPPPPPDGGNAGGGGTGGTGGTGNCRAESGTGTNVCYCVNKLIRGAYQPSADWHALPGFPGLDVQVFWSTNYNEFDVAFRNRYTQRIYFHYGAAGTQPAHTSFDLSVPAGTAVPHYGGVDGAVSGGSACILLNSVRFGSDQGPYQ